MSSVQHSLACTCLWEKKKKKKKYLMLGVQPSCGCGTSLATGCSHAKLKWTGIRYRHTGNAGEHSGGRTADQTEQETCSNTTHPEHKYWGHWNWRSPAFLQLSKLWHSVYSSLWQTPPIWQQVKNTFPNTCWARRECMEECVCKNETIMSVVHIKHIYKNLTKILGRNDTNQHLKKAQRTTIL